MVTSIEIKIPSISKDATGKRDILDAALIAKSVKIQESGTIQADMTELLPWMANASKEAVDFTLLSMFIYGIDRFLPRRANSIDGWSRELNVSIPVYQLTKWNPNKKALEKLLSFLTGDYWTVLFYKNTMQLPAQQVPPIYQGSFAQINLFSGGLDSLIGAIDGLETSKLPILFVSHYDPTMGGPKKDQEDVSFELKREYTSTFIRLPSVKVFLSQSSLTGSETTCRSRSLLFLGLASLLADVKGIGIIVPENGTVSLNYPLSPSRRSACSTRTTHPTFLDYIHKLWGSLAINTTITNPYWNKTKGEMVTACQNQALLKSMVALSNSCGKRGHRSHWNNRQATHCGSCMPCAYRQASLQGVRDSTIYGNTINNLTFTKKKGQDISALKIF